MKVKTMSFIHSRDKSYAKDSKRRISLSYATSGTEPSLAELFSDPIIHLIAQSDRIALEELRGHVEQARLKIKKTPMH
jgi:hypothetical protein